MLNMSDHDIIESSSPIYRVALTKLSKHRINCIKFCPWD